MAAAVNDDNGETPRDRVQGEVSQRFYDHRPFQAKARTGCTMGNGVAKTRKNDLVQFVFHVDQN